MPSDGEYGADGRVGVVDPAWEHHVNDLASESALPGQESDDPDLTVIVRTGRFILHDLDDLVRCVSTASCSNQRERD